MKASAKECLYTLRESALLYMQLFLPIALRITFGLNFIMAGYMKLGMMNKVIAGFGSMGIPFAGILGPFVSLVELIGGLLLLAGLGTRLAAFFLAGVMIVALGTAHRDVFAQGMDAILTAPPFAYLLAMLVLFTYGAGCWSVDAKMCKAKKKQGK